MLAAGDVLVAHVGIEELDDLQAQKGFQHRCRALRGEGRPDDVDQEPEESAVAAGDTGDNDRVDEAGRLPAFKAVAARIELAARIDQGRDALDQPEQAAQDPPEEAFVDGVIETALDPRKIALHVLGAPRLVAGELRDPVPIRFVGPDNDHRVM